MRFRVHTLLLFLLGALAHAENPARKNDFFVIKDFHFKSGESLPEVQMHYITLGSPQKDASGKVTNAVLILHGTGGSARNFLVDHFAGVLFGPGQLLDAGKYYIILPDNLGHGRSSKPSQGLHMRFPHYEYDDMIELQYRLVTEGLGVNHLRLVMGTSMGGMHTWLWGEQHPDFMDALLPLASLPVQIAGRNRIMRKMVMEAIRSDPEWKNGEYTSEPHGLACALNVLFLMGSSPLQLQKLAPTRDQADEEIKNYIENEMQLTDANDMLYYVDASRNYNPAPDLKKIVAPLTAINSADDVINPPELKILDSKIKEIKNGKFVLIPISDETHGHGTHSWPALWKEHLQELLERSAGAATK